MIDTLRVVISAFLEMSKYIEENYLLVKFVRLSIKTILTQKKKEKERTERNFTKSHELQDKMTPFCI